MKPVDLIFVGGFLGAGKTTLLGQAGRELLRQGKRVGFITNDQAAQLVDSQALRHLGLNVEEVSGGCFCCHFDDLLNASQKLIDEHKPDVLIGEPVGSCVDILATVLQPLKTFHPKRFRVAPFSVVVDPVRLREILQDSGTRRLAEKVAYIYSKQLEEADLILLNKQDLISESDASMLKQELARRFPHAAVLGITALQGHGVATWLQNLYEPRTHRSREIRIDYDRYAEGEAQLGWLNASARLRAPRDIPWKPVCMRLLRGLKEGFGSEGVEVAHVKISLTAQGCGLVGNLTSTQGHPFLFVTGAHDRPSREAKLILNARVQSSPKQLDKVVQSSLDNLPEGELEVALEKVECFSPGRPQPTHRLAGDAAPEGGEGPSTGKPSCQCKTRKSSP